jgi:hypothetical protein
MQTDLNITVTAQSPAYARLGDSRAAEGAEARRSWKQVAEADWFTYRIGAREAEAARGALVDVAA